MLLFLLKKEVFEWVIARQKTVELRRGKGKRGDYAVFQCGRNIIRKRIIKREEGNLTAILRQDNYKNIIPIAQSLEEATIYLKSLYETINETFTAHYLASALMLCLMTDGTYRKNGDNSESWSVKK